MADRWRAGDRNSLINGTGSIFPYYTSRSILLILHADSYPVLPGFVGYSAADGGQMAGADIEVRI